MSVDDFLSVQLYSLRFMASLDDQLRLVRSCGLSLVEAFGPCYDDVRGFRALLDRHELASPSGHIGIEILRDSPARAADLCATVGIEHLVLWGFPETERPTTERGWARAGEQLGRIAQQLDKDSVTLAFHNHHWELERFDNGRFALDILFDAAQGTALAWEADLAWLAYGHADVEAVTARHRQRISACHVKDIAKSPDSEEGWADLGQGILPWRDWWPKMRAYGARWMILEHDAPSDPARFLRRSAAAARAIDLETA
jgi:sugar phosphate isomerase/epimerase